MMRFISELLKMLKNSVDMLTPVNIKVPFNKFVTN